MIRIPFLNKVQFSEKPNSNKYLQVYSHPRSGTHFLEAFLGENFYYEEDLAINKVEWGHWSSRKVSEEPNKFGKLFGSHIYPGKYLKGINNPSIYIFRDPRSVALSIWKTPNFINSEQSQLGFSSFIRQKIDWVGSPAYKCRPKYNIFQHWAKHVSGWMKIAKANQNIIVLQYEDLLDKPYEIYLRIYNNFNFQYPLLKDSEINTIESPTGLLPNKATKDAWKVYYTGEDLHFMKKHLPKKLWPQE